MHKLEVLEMLKLQFHYFEVHFLFLNKIKKELIQFQMMKSFETFSFPFSSRSCDNNLTTKQQQIITNNNNYNKCCSAAGELAGRKQWRKQWRIQ
jgi:hypothetical protein